MHRWTGRRFASLLPAVALLVCVGAGRAQASGSTPTGASVDGAWAQQPLSLAPPPNENLAAAYDPVRGQVFVFGGYDGSTAVNTLWSFSASGIPHWNQVLTLGAPPPARLAHSMIYDPVRDRLLVFGGTPNGSAALGDVWALSLAGTPTWSQLSVVGSGPTLFAHSAVYDPVRDRMLVYGGKSVSAASGDTWALSLADPPTWSLLSTAGTIPNRRYFSSAIYDPASDCMIIFGGNTDLGNGSFGVTNDVWSLSLAGTPTWTTFAAGGSFPAPRRSHGALYDATQGRMIVYGGLGNSLTLNTVYSLTLGASPTWTNITPAGTQPTGRSAFAFVIDPDSSRAIAFAGLQQATLLGDTWALGLGATTSWTSLTNTLSGPGARLAHEACYDSKRRAMDVFGGTDNVSFHGELWTLPLTQLAPWSQVDYPSVLRPAGREASALVYDAEDDRVVMFGGADATHVYDDTWSFDPNTNQWSLLLVPGTNPSARKGMATIYDPVHNRMIVFGGYSGFQALAETWALTLGAAPHWDRILTSSVPAARFSSAMVYDAPHDRAVMFGGFDNQSSQRFSDEWMLNMSGPPAWNLLNPSNAGPGARDAMLGVFDALRDRMIVFGGYNGGSAVNDVYALNLGGGTAMWSRLQPFGGPPSPRDLTAGVYDPLADRLVMYAGNAKSGPTGTLLGVADLWTLTWGDQPTPTRLAFADERTEPGSVRLTWFTPDGGGQRAVAQRSTDGATWEDVAQLTSDASGEFVLDDAVPTGGRFDYRLGVALPDGEQFTDGHWVVIPVGVAFGFTSVGPNPSRGALRVAFALAAPGAAWLDLYDVAGRRVEHRDLAAFGVGAHTVELAPDHRLASGVYVLRLAQGRRAVERKIAVVR